MAVVGIPALEAVTVLPVFGAVVCGGCGSAQGCDDG